MPALKEESVPDWIPDAGSAFHIRTVAGKKGICRCLSGHLALDTSGRDLIFTWLTSGYYAGADLMGGHSCSGRRGP